MKKILFISLCILVFLIVWMGYSYSKPPILVGSSENDEWYVEVVPERSPKDTWVVKLNWEGEYIVSAVTLAELSYTSDDTSQFYWNDKENIEPGDYFKFAYQGGRPIYSDPTLRIHWIVDGESMEELIHFQEKKRLFVIPLSPFTLNN